MAGGSDDRCALCQRRMSDLTRHHLIPRTRHRNKKLRRLFSREEMQQRVIDVCRPCHRHIHATLDEKSLALHYNTLEALQGHPEIQRFVEWIGHKPEGFKPKSRRWKQSKR